MSVLFHFVAGEGELIEPPENPRTKREGKKNEGTEEIREEGK